MRLQDLVQKAMAAEEAGHAGLAALAVWLRLAAMRKLTWNREACSLLGVRGKSAQGGLPQSCMLNARARSTWR